MSVPIALIATAGGLAFIGAITFVARNLQSKTKESSVNKPINFESPVNKPINNDSTDLSEYGSAHGS